MKKKIVIILALVIFKVAIGFGQLTQLLNMNYKNYVGKPVDTLIAALPSGYTGMQVFALNDNHTASALEIAYPNNVRLYIHVLKFKYMNPSKSLAGSWDISLFKKEAISFSIVYDNSGCLVGCDNECFGCPDIAP